MAAAGASAQSPPPRAADALTLAAVLGAARDNGDVASARQALAAARADVLAADHAPAPVLSGKFSDIDLQNGVGNGSLLGRKRIDKSVGIDWTWERGGKRAARTAASERAVEAAAADVDDMREQQLALASDAYFDLLGAEARIEQVAAIERSAAQLAGTAARRVQAGDLARQEASRTEIEAYRGRLDLQSAELDRQRALLTISLVANRPIAANVRADAADWPATAASLASIDMDGVVEARPPVRAARERGVAAEAALRAAEAQRSADVTLGVSLDHFPGTSNRLLEVRASMPLQWNYRFEGEIGRAQAQLAQAREGLDKARREARADLARLRLEADTQSRRLAAYESDILSRAHQVADNAELAFRRGAMSLSDLLDARRTLRATELDAIAARVDHAKALFAWRLKTGNLPQP